MIKAIILVILIIAAIVWGMEDDRLKHECSHVYYLICGWKDMWLIHTSAIIIFLIFTTPLWIEYAFEDGNVAVQYDDYGFIAKSSDDAIFCWSNCDTVKIKTTMANYLPANKPINVQYNNAWAKYPNSQPNIVSYTAQFEVTDLPKHLLAIGHNDNEFLQICQENQNLWPKYKCYSQNSSTNKKIIIRPDVETIVQFYMDEMNYTYPITLEAYNQQIDYAPEIEKKLTDYFNPLLQKYGIQMTSLVNYEIAPYTCVAQWH